MKTAPLLVLKPGGDHAEHGGRRRRVRPHRDIEKLIARYGRDTAVFRPTIGELIEALETDPKRFSKKRGLLKEARAADLRFADGITWRAVFVLDDPSRTVYLLSLDSHDVAYAKAKRRI